MGGDGVVVTGYETKGRLQECDVSDCAGDGVAVERGAEPALVSNRISDFGGAGVVIRGAYTKGRVEGNIISGASGTSGVAIEGGADPILFRNEIRGMVGVGVVVSGGNARGRLEGNVIAGSAEHGVLITAGADPVLVANRIHGGKGCGVCAKEDARGRLERNELWGNEAGGVWVINGRLALVGNAIRDHTAAPGASSGFGVRVELGARVNATLLEDNAFGQNERGDVVGDGWGRLLEDRASYAAALRKFALRWATQAAVAHDARAAGAAPPDAVFPPDAFDVTVAPGEGVQEAVDRCPQGGAVLLLPGVHRGPLELLDGKEVHVFGRGQAVLWNPDRHVVVSTAARATLDGLVLQPEFDYDPTSGRSFRCGPPLCTLGQKRALESLGQDDRDLAGEA